MSSASATATATISPRTEPTWEQKRAAQESHDRCIVFVIASLWLMIGLSALVVIPAITSERVLGLREDVRRMMEALNLTEVECVAKHH